MIDRHRHTFCVDSSLYCDVLTARASESKRRHEEFTR